jgi:arylsulfate sulfotransferase
MVGFSRNGVSDKNMHRHQSSIFAKTILFGAALHLTLAALPLGAVSTQLAHSISGTAHPVGTVVQWAATNAGSAGTTLQYRWVITQNGTNVVFRDFNTTSTITYTPLQEGPYTVTVTARNAANPGDTDTVSTTLTASSLLSGTAQKVTGTNNPLVAIYSATCTSGSNIRVFFSAPGTQQFATPIQPCVTGKSVNFIIAGMRANTTYNLQHQIQSGFSFSYGPVLHFTTGSIPATVSLPKLTATGSPTTQQPVLLYSGFTLPVAFDTSGNVIWYTSSPLLLFRPLNGGTMLLGEGDDLQEIDLLGNVLRETNITRVQEQLSAPPFNIINGKTNRVADFNHDAIRLPNGYTATISLMEQIANQGPAPNPKDVLGDLVLVLDQNFQVKWAWNPFGRVKLPITRLATLNDTCMSFTNGCPALKLIPSGQTLANDWLHANSLNYTGDGDLLLSLRSQDWVLKLDYANGAGTGDIIWRLGNDGDFTLSGGQWFSHQHNATLRGTTLLLFDNANADETNFGGSRGLVLTINEEAKTADIVDEALMHVFSGAVGSAQILLNGNLWFLAGFVGSTSEAIEFTPGSMANPVAHFATTSNNYRSFRMTNLYTP